MNYRHIYHAGNVCDVVKHAVLTCALERLRAKETPFAVVDTHAGCGLYDLNDPRAQKTREHEEGIGRLLRQTPEPEIEAYANIVKSLGADGLCYPGSPMLTRAMLRGQDRLIACELHPEDSQELKRLFHNDKQVHVHRRDGYEALGALLPPKEKRGLVLIDPPFESTDEFERLQEALATCAHKWPQACVMVWYPVKERPAVWRFHESLAALKLPCLFYAEFLFNDETRHDRLNGSGLILANAPWQFDNAITRIFTALHDALATRRRDSALKWLNAP